MKSDQEIDAEIAALHQAAGVRRAIALELHPPYREHYRSDPATWGPVIVEQSRQWLDRPAEDLARLKRDDPSKRPKVKRRNPHADVAFRGPLHQSFLAASPGRRVTLRAHHLSSWTGYGQIACEVARGLDLFGVPVAIESPHVDEGYYPLPDWVRDRLVEQSPDRWVVNLAPPISPSPSGRKVIALTMWEVSMFSRENMAHLSQAEAVIVPCRANADWLRESGLERPIYVVPLGIDPTVYHDAGEFPAGKFVFGAAGRYAHGGTRKNLDCVARSFARVADRMPDARLVLKVWPDCDLRNIPDHPRIEVFRDPMTPAEIAGWYRSLSCYVTASRGEGWGMQTHQAMAVGRPAIAVPWSGTVDFWTPECGWPLEYSLEPAGDFYAGHGLWATPTSDSLCEAMLAAYRDPGGCRRKGRLAARRAAEFTWGRTVAELQIALIAAGALLDPNMPKPSENGQPAPYPPSQAELDRQEDRELVEGLSAAQNEAVVSCPHRWDEMVGCCLVTRCRYDPARLRPGRSVTAECGRCVISGKPR